MSGRLLVRMPNWIGDAVMATPALLGLERALPEWKIAIQAIPRTWSLWEGLVGRFELLPPLPAVPGRGRTPVRIARELRRHRFDAALLFPPSFSSAVVPALAGIPIRVGWASELRRVLLTDPVSGRTRERHLRTQYLELAARLARKLEGGAVGAAPEGTRVPLTAEELERAHRWWEESGMDPARTIALAPGATYGETKRWPVPRYRELARLLLDEGWEILWVGGREETELAHGLVAELDAGPCCRSVAGAWGLRETLAGLSAVRGVVSNDSGALHLAQAAGVPVVGIFGSTSPAWTGPVGETQAVLYDGIACSPCFARTCPTEIECLGGIGVERVRSALARLTGPVFDAPRRGRPAILLDRDGTILTAVPYLNDPGQVSLLPGAAAGLRAFQEAGYALVVVTNQSAIARGMLDHTGLRIIHQRMEALLAEEGIVLTGIEVCPHHPEFTGACACRKPAPGMLRRAIHRFGLDPGASWMIGDSPSDLEAGRRGGLRPILVRTGYGRETEPSEPDVPAFDTLLEVAASVIPAHK